MKHFTLPFFLVVAFIAQAASAAESSIETVLRIDASRLTAMMDGDGAALGGVFSNDVTFVHSDGRAEGKTAYIKAMTAGDTSYENVKTSNVEAKQVTPDVIVLIGAQEMRKKLGPDWSEIKLRFMSVWRNESGTWRMIAWQSLRPAGNSVVPKR